MNKQYIYSFADGDGKNKKLLGGKGANLCEMTQIGLNVPPGFVITTEACLDYLQANALPSELMASVRGQINKLETLTNKTFGKGADPLSGLGAVRFSTIDAGYDGHHPESRSE